MIQRTVVQPVPAPAPVPAPIPAPALAPVFAPENPTAPGPGPGPLQEAPPSHLHFGETPSVPVAQQPGEDCLQLC